MDAEYFYPAPLQETPGSSRDCPIPDLTLCRARGGPATVTRSNSDALFRTCMNPLAGNCALEKRTLEYLNGFLCT